MFADVWKNSRGDDDRSGFPKLPEQQIEAAKIGRGQWLQRFIYIPSIYYPSLQVAMVLRIIEAVKVLISSMS